jgi:hypothetical protein
MPNWLQGTFQGRQTDHVSPQKAQKFLSVHARLLGSSTSEGDPRRILAGFGM